MTKTNENQNKESSKAQCARILAHLQTGCGITALQALKYFGCFRLSARIHELKKVHPIKSDWIKENGKKVKIYFL